MWEKLTFPHDSIREIERRRRAHMLASMLLVLIVAGIIGVLLTLLTSDSILSIFIISIGLIITCLAYGLSRTKYYKIAAITIIINLLGTVLIGAILKQDPEYLIFLVLGILLSSLFLSPRSTIFVSLATVIIILLLPVSLVFLFSVVVIKSAFLIGLTGILATIAASIQSFDIKHIEEQAVELSTSLSEIGRGREALQNSETRLTNILDNAAEAIVSVDEAQKIILFNQGAEKIFQYRSSEVLGQSLDLLLPQRFVEPHHQVVDDFNVSSRSSRSMEMRKEVIGRRKDGCEFPAQVGISNHREGNHVFSTAILIDLSDRKLAEEKLKQSEARLQLQIARMPIACILWDTQFCVSSWNPMAERIFGFSAEDVLGECPFDLITSEKAKISVKEILDQLLNGDTVARSIIENRTKNGHIILCEWSNTLLNGSDGKTIGVLSMVQDITTRVQAQEALIASELRYHNFFDRIPVALYRTSLQGQILEINPALVALLGYPDRETLLETNVYDLYIDPNDRAQANRILELEGVIRDNQFELKRFDGSRIWVRDTSRIVMDDAGVFYFEGSLEDVTERKRAEGLIRRHNEDLTLINAINSAVNRGESLDTVIELISEESKRIFNCLGTTLYLLNETGDRLVMQNLALSPHMTANIEKLFDVPIPPIEHNLSEDNLFHQVVESKQGFLITDPAEIQAFVGTYIDSSPFSEGVRSRLKNLVPALVNLLGQKSLVIVPLICGNEAIGTLEMGSRGILTRDDLQRFEFIASHLTVAIQRKQAGDKLAASESKLRALFAAMQDVVLIMDEDGIYREIAPTNPGLLYEPPEILLGKSLRDVFPKDEAEFFLSAIRTVLATGSLKQIEYQLQIRGNPHWFLANITPMGETETLWVAHEITNRKHAEEVLRQSELRYHTLTENSPVGIFRTNSSGLTTYVNPRWCEIAGLTEAEALGNGWLSAVHPNDQASLVTEGQWSEEDRNTSSQEYRFQRPDGTVVWVMGQVIPEKGINGNVVSYVGTVTDITERRQAELVLQRLYNDARHHARVMETLNRIGQKLTASLSQSEIIEQLGSEAGDLLRAGNFAVILRDETSAEYELKFYIDEGERKKLGRFTLDQGLTAIILSTGEAILAEDYLKECEKRRVRPTDFGRPAKAWLGVPIIAGDHALGALLVWDYDHEGSFNTQDIQILSTLAAQTAIAFKNAHLIEDAHQRLRQTLALREVDRAIAGSMNIQFVLKIVLKHALNELNVDAAVILLFDPTDGKLKYELGSGFKTTALQHTSLGLGSGYAGRVALERQIIRISNLRTRTTDFLRSPTFQKEGFDCYFGVPLIAKGEIKGVLEIFHRAPLAPESEWLEFLETLASQIAIAIDNANLYKDLRQSNIELTLAYEKTIEGWSKALDLRDKETEGHTRRVTELTLQLARAMGVSEGEILHIQRGAILHDIGKMGVPDRILLKPDLLTNEEWEIMRMHPVFAYEMLYPIEYLHPALDIPYCHHEKWDGTGYPRGLKREEIPLAARIFAVVDVWDALTIDRPYRPAWPIHKALKHIEEQSGRHFDPQVVEAFLRSVPKSDRENLAS